MVYDLFGIDEWINYVCDLFGKFYIGYRVEILDWKLCCLDGKV